MAMATLRAKTIAITITPIAMPTGTTLTARLRGINLAAMTAPAAMPNAQMPWSTVACDSV